MKKRLIAIILTLATLWLCAVPAFAARKEEFISDVALIYEDSVEDALKKIEGTDWKLYEQDLNANADYSIDDGVYLIYKTSTNVEDAITDLRVMDMYGGYSISDYESQLEKSREGYMTMIEYIRTAASEFKALYEAGDEMAKLAYRQMNYYKDVKVEKGTETDMLMGDFFLDLPADDKIVQVFMEGNSYVTANLLLLLAIGISGAGEDTFLTRIDDFYAKKDELTEAEYHDDAAALAKVLEDIESDLRYYESKKDDFNLNDEDISEDEFLFLSQYGTTATMLEGVMLGTVDLKTFLLTTEWTIKDLYPIVAAMTDGQRALMNLGMFEAIIQYGDANKPMDRLNALVEEYEADMTREDGKIVPIDVYVGVDRSIFNGAFAFTNAAERQQALTGETWGIANAWDESLRIPAAIVAGLSALVGLTPVVAMYVIIPLLTKIVTKTATAHFMLHAYCANISFWFANKVVVNGIYFIGVSAGLALIAAGLIGFSLWYNYYNPNYTEIPATMIDVKETDAGDKYIKYTAAGVYGDEDGRLADFNAYEGKEWIALYYTKDATAGNCLTPNFKISSDNSTVARRYQGVNMFGETKAFNLNSHVYNDGAEEIYLTVRYSNTKKAAVDMPDVVGTILGVGGYALAAGLGLGVGMGIMGIVNKSKKKKEEAEIPA